MFDTLLISLLFFATAQQSADQATQDIQRSHIEANVPAPADFDRFLQRDLRSYFAQARKSEEVRVEFELLREGPTQTGVSYPKFYAWVRVDGGKSPADRGAVRLAAIEKKRFEVTDFVSEQAVRKDPDGISQIFPGAVCERIKSKLEQ